MHLKSLNLYGNRICDRGVQTIAEALETNYALRYLGLGRNRVTQEGLKTLMSSVGGTRVDEERAKELQKGTIPTEADKAKKLKAFPPAKKDAKGRERHQAPCHFDELEEKTDENGETYWMWYRNIEFQILNLEQNPISDKKVIDEMRPLGVGVLILRGTPVAKKVLQEEERKRKEAEKEAAAAEAAGKPAPIAEEKEEEKPVEEPAEQPRRTEWMIHYS